MKVYFDACCLARLFDDQTIDRNHLEAEAIIVLLRRVYRGEWQMVSSEMLEVEIEAGSDAQRKELCKGFLALQSERVIVGEAELQRATALRRHGLGLIDAVHLACAEAGGCKVMFTTDDRLLKCARRIGRIGLEVANPLGWLEAQRGQR